MGIGVLIEAGIFGVVWFVEPPSYPASAVSQFAFSILFCMGVVACTGVKGFWKRLLLLAPALAVMILSEAIVPRLVEESSHSIGSYWFGFVFGFFLMYSGFQEPRGQRTWKL
jgi:hypothetical protein